MLKTSDFLCSTSLQIHYYWYLKIRKQCQEVAEVEGTRCDMGGFTRLLHDDQPDDLVDEIPTFVAKTLPKEHPHHGYIVRTACAHDRLPTFPPSLALPRFARY